MIELIVAISDNGVIGDANQVPWTLPEDMKYFRTKTEDHTVIMGRKTYDSINPKYRPLKNRFNIVITRNPDIEKEAGVAYVSSFEEALNLAKNQAQNIFIIGGAEIYKMALESNLLDVLHITRVHTEIDGAVKFPEWKEYLYQKTLEIPFTANDKNLFSMTFETWVRKW